MRDKIFFPTHFPLFVTLGPNAIDILTGDLRIYVYFDVDAFTAICKSIEVKPRWISPRELRGSKYRISTNIPDPPKFASGYLGLEYPEGHVRIFMHGLLYSMAYELETGESVARIFKTKDMSAGAERRTSSLSDSD